MRRSLIAAGLFFMLALPVRAEISLQNYCKDGYYQIPGEKKCSRAPKCAGKSYDELNKAELMPDHNDCLDEGRGPIIGNPQNTSAFYGYYPLCCYEMARLHDPEMCIGYWERLWCHPDQCAKIDNEHGCSGGGCQCAHATKGWCETRHCTLLPPVPMEVRLHMVTPTPSAAPQPTAVPSLPPTQAPAPTVAAYPTDTLQPTLPPHRPGPFRIGTPVPTAVPLIPTTAIAAPTTVSTAPTTPFTLPAGTKIALRSAIINADRGFRAAGNAVYTVHQADASLETYINSLFRRLLIYLRLSPS